MVFNILTVTYNYDRKEKEWRAIVEIISRRMGERGEEEGGSWRWACYAGELTVLCKYWLGNDIVAVNRFRYIS